MKEITTAEVGNLLNEDKNVMLIDVREYDEVQAGKIPEAKHIPLGELAIRIQEIEKDAEEYIMICRSGNRSKAACGLMEALGFKATNMLGGMNDWKGAVE